MRSELKTSHNITHLDVMDGDDRFYGIADMPANPEPEKVRPHDALPRFVKASSLYFDGMELPSNYAHEAHIMAMDPNRWAAWYAGNDAIDTYIIHAEAISGDREMDRVLGKIKETGKQAGIALNPDTPLDTIIPYLDDNRLDMVLMMTVVPGAYGGKFREDTITKIAEARNIFPGPIAVDGAQNENNIPKCRDAGADVFYVGSAIMGKETVEQRQDAYHELERLANA
jgi:ribulose-phosphate 3-epimerase